VLKIAKEILQKAKSLNLDNPTASSLRAAATGPTGIGNSEITKLMKNRRSRKAIQKELLLGSQKTNVPPNLSSANQVQAEDIEDQHMRGASGDGDGTS